MSYTTEEVMDATTTQQGTEALPSHQAPNNLSNNNFATKHQVELPAIFNTVLKQLQLDRALLLCAIIRQRQCGATRPSDSLIPTVGDERFCGSYNVVIPINFEDGTCWMLKVPANGTPTYFDSAASAALTSEARTMQFLKKNTTIPIPEVFAFDATVTNELGCPFILMERLPGYQLHKLWFNDSWTPERLQRLREQSLKNIAQAMAQLRSFTFDKAGMVEYDSSGDISGIGPSRIVDLEAARKAQDVEFDRGEAGLEEVEDEEDDEPYKLAGPWSTEQEYYHQHLPMRTSARQRLLHKYFPWVRTHGELQDRYDRGMNRFVHKLIDCIPPCTDDQPFVLGHPDFGLQNFLVSLDGKLQGIIDWHGIQSVPRSVGYESYPKWLIEDWSPPFPRNPHENHLSTKSSSDSVLSAPAELDTEETSAQNDIETPGKEMQAQNEVEPAGGETPAQSATERTGKEAQATTDEHDSLQLLSQKSFCVQCAELPEDTIETLVALRALYKQYLQDAITADEPEVQTQRINTQDATNPSRYCEASLFVSNLMDRVSSTSSPSQICKKFLEEFKNVLGTTPPYEFDYRLFEITEAMCWEGLDSETESYLKRGMAALFGVQPVESETAKKRKSFAGCRNALLPVKRRCVQWIKDQRGSLCVKLRARRSKKNAKKEAKAAEEKAKRDAQLAEDRDTSL